MRRFALLSIVLVAAVLAAALAAAAVATALSRGWQRERLRSALESVLARELGAEVAIGALEGPLAPRVALRELRIGSAEAPSLEAAELAIDWDPAASWNARVIAIRSLRVLAPRIAASLDAEGRPLAPGLLPDPDAEPIALPLPLRIDRVTFDELHMRLSWEDAAGPAELRAQGGVELSALRWGPDGGGLADARLALELAAAGAARRWLETARVEAVHEAGSVRVDADAVLAPALGRLALRARGETLDAVELLSLALEGGDYPPIELARPTLVRRDGERFVVEDLEIRGGKQSLRLAGALSPERFEGLRIVGRELDASLAARLAGASDLAGRISGELVLDGPLASPSGRGRIAWTEPRIDGWTGDRIAAEGEWSERSAALAGEIAHEGRVQLSFDVALPLPAGGVSPWWERLGAGEPGAALPSQLRVGLRAHELELAALSPWIPARIRELRGELSGEISIAGGTSPRAEGSLALANLGVGIEGLARPIEVARAELEIAPDPAGIRIARLDVVAPELRIETQGALALAGPRGLELHARIDDLEAFAVAHDLPHGIPGSFDARLRLDGGWRHPSIDGSLAWRHPAPGAIGPSRVEIDLASEGPELGGELRVWQAERVAARGEFRHPYPPWSELQATALVGPGAELVVHAEDFELATVAPLLGRRVRDLRGRVDARVSVRGGTDRPTLEGTLEARDASLRIPVLRQTFEPIEARLSFRDDTLRVDRLRVGREGAHAELAGSVDLDVFLRPHRADLEIAFERFPASRSRVLAADIDGRARLEGPLERPILRGALTLQDLRVRLADPGDPALREIRVIASDAARDESGGFRETQEEPNPLDRAQVDLQIDVPRNSWVRGQGANIELAGRLQIDKASYDPLRVSGEVTVQRGTYRFQGRRFDVRRGTATFDGGADPDPLLDVEARRRAGDVMVIVTLTGRLSAPTIRLSSEPDLPEDDVLAYLFFGRPARDLRETGTSERQLEAAASALAAGIALGEASETLEGLVPIDSFDVEMREDGRSADVSVGKYVTDDFFVTYERRLGGDPIDGVRLHLRIGDNWSIATDAATDESAGADLIWSYDY